MRRGLGAALFCVPLFMACDARTDTGGGEHAAFPAFWAEFQQAVKEDDAARIAGLACDPFEVAGAVDGIPPEELDREGVEEGIGALLTEERFDDTSRAVIVGFDGDPAGLEEDGMAALGDLEFEKRDGAWCFARLYREEG